MKRIYILLLFCALTFIGNSQTKYTIKFESSLNPKDIIEELSINTETYNRYVIDSVTISFCSNDILNDDFFFQKNSSYLTINSITRMKSSTGFLSQDKAGGVNCPQAQLLCNNTSLAGNSNGSGLQELNNSNHGCLTDNEHQSSWYYLNVQSGGVLNFRINPNTNNDDYDFALWGPFTSATAAANCPPSSSPIRCNWSSGNGNTGLSSQGSNNSVGAGGSKWSNPLNVLAGEVYILLIDNYSISNSGYNLDFTWTQPNGNNGTTTATLGCTPIVLPIELTDFKVENKIDNIVSWSTAVEINNDYFTLEQSTDGLSWNRLATVKGAGNSTTQNDYSVIHTDYVNKLNYYRLSQTDYDGKQEYFPIISIDNSSESKQIIRVTNLFGQEVNDDYTGIRIILFSDGTTIKKMTK